MPLELSLACPTLHSVMGPPDPHPLDLPPRNPFPTQPHSSSILHRDSPDAARIAVESFNRQGPVQVHDVRRYDPQSADAADCIDAKQTPSRLQCKEKLANDGMVLTLALAQYAATASSNDQKRACQNWELGSNRPQYTHELHDDHERTLNEGSSRASGEEEGAGGCSAGARKKLRLSKEKSALLEERFKEQSTLTPKQKNALAKQLNLQPRQVEVWFQNRRARTKLKQTELDCELLRKCCASLSEENQRLQIEVAQLRALKVGPHSPMPIPQTLTMCPQCECISAHAMTPSPSTTTTTSNSSLHQVPTLSLSLSPRQRSSPAPST